MNLYIAAYPNGVVVPKERVAEKSPVKEELKILIAESIFIHYIYTFKSSIFEHLNKCIPLFLLNYQYFPKNSIE